ncbi:LOW QUALITY PROTEIN: hypothetical protein OSB04_028962 [Centaurea solstitialis]|uniref:Uncharacterized protein n=1 Tax=Centaurea solstitialis TaxID=347529 RepID=A0AA38STN8_9ASTR|nr:LOW QUALITY PROTEIN: hypothetical protein OSB04_028962 [Centaurea solstitialis]
MAQSTPWKEIRLSRSREMHEQVTVFQKLLNITEVETAEPLSSVTETLKKVSHPPNANFIRSMWIFAHKKCYGSLFQRHKARLVTEKLDMPVTVDCKETLLSLVVKPATIRTVLSLTFSKNGQFTNLV